MIRRYKVAALMILAVLTIAAEALVTLWSQSLNYAGTPLNDSLELAISWGLIIAGMVAVVAIFGPTDIRAWLAAIIFLVVTAIGTLYVSQAVLAEYRYRREFTTLGHAPWLRFSTTASASNQSGFAQSRLVVFQGRHRPPLDANPSARNVP